MSPSTTFSTLVVALITLLSSSWAQAEGTLVLMSTNKGDMVIELDQDRAPQSVRNFLQYADDGFYNDTIFHRVIEGFMIQGGGFTQDYKRKNTRAPVSNEAYNGLKNRQYSIAMARTTAPHSATSQFFINSVANRNLDHTNTTQRGWGYTVFGQVVKGEEIVEAISQVRTGPGGPFGRDVPAEAVVILKVERINTMQDATDAGNAAQPSAKMADPKDTTIQSESAGKLKADKAQPIEQN
ncbi:MAG: peptidylprolyl isomerase [Granulosicoccus sp.]